MLRQEEGTAWNGMPAFITSYTARLWQRSLNSTTGSAASSVTLGEVARCPPDEALQRLGGSANGLTTQEAEARLRSVGPNEVAHEVRHTIPGEIISRSINPLNLLLLTLAATSYFLGDQRAAIMIAVKHRATLPQTGKASTSGLGGGNEVGSLHRLI